MKKNSPRFNPFPYPQIEFVAPYPLEDCVKRIQELDKSDRRLYEPEGTQIHTIEWKNDLYQFEMEQDGGKYWAIKGLGELRYLDANQTRVHASAKIARGSSCMLIATALLLIFMTSWLTVVQFWSVYCLWFTFAAFFVFYLLDQRNLSRKSREVLEVIEDALLPEPKEKRKST